MGRYLNASNTPALATNFGAAGAYGNSTTTGAAAGAAGAAGISVKPVTERSQHVRSVTSNWWLDNLRSNVTGGMEYIDIPAALVSKTTSLNKEHLKRSHANLIWNPVSLDEIDIGLEYTLGVSRTATNNAHATPNADQRIQVPLLSRSALRSG